MQKDIKLLTDFDIECPDLVPLDLIIERGKWCILLSIFEGTYSSSSSKDKNLKAAGNKATSHNHSNNNFAKTSKPPSNNNRVSNCVQVNKSLDKQSLSSNREALHDLLEFTNALKADIEEQIEIVDQRFADLEIDKVEDISPILDAIGVLSQRVGDVEFENISSQPLIILIPMMGLVDWRCLTWTLLILVLGLLIGEVPLVYPAIGWVKTNLTVAPPKKGEDEEPIPSLGT
ncbi:hypothetical protein SUGI_0008510 [Cryptomeria japonica]|nr:hypothetical protein SUGI_0008510 [Cryptomeria japonica]